jgi:hypothetical protein
MVDIQISREQIMGVALGDAHGGPARLTEFLNNCNISANGVFFKANRYLLLDFSPLEQLVLFTHRALRALQAADE